MLSNNIIYLLYQPGATIDNLTGLRLLMFHRKQEEFNKIPQTKSSLLQSVKRSRYQSTIWKSANESIPTKQLLNNHIGDDKLTFMFLL